MHEVRDATAWDGQDLLEYVCVFDPEPSLTIYVAARKSTGKRLRFEVFKRDGFTCRYCGAQPPDVVLVVDHIDPVVAGGDSDISNLNTACEACNQGKGARSLTAVQPRPDADLLYLETQQEIAELRRYRQAMALRDAERREYAHELREQWFDTISPKEYGPTVDEVCRLIERFGHEAAFEAMVVTANAIARGRLWDRSKEFVPYMFGVAKRFLEQQGE